MGKIINLIVAAVIFYIIEYMLVPMLDEPARHFIGLLVVIAAILFLLGELVNYKWPWTKEKHD